MINIQLFNEDVVKNKTHVPIYNFKSCYRVNIIGGESGTGKTLFFNNLVKALNGIDDWSIKCNKEILIGTDLNQLRKELKNTSEKIVICDEDTTQLLLKQNLCNLISSSKNYFILMDRGMEACVETNVKALFDISGTGEVIAGIQLFNIKESLPLTADNRVSNLCKFTHIITEDSESGKLFWSNMLDKLSMIDGLPGKSNVPTTILNNIHKCSGIVVAMDYDTSLGEMLSILRDENIDKSRITFISMESFEEVICNSEFILEKFPELRDRVLNYDKYLDSSYKHTGKYFSDLLFTYVKVKSPLKEHGSKNATKFYEKGMKNFEACFLRDCCEYNCEDTCKLFTNKDKKKLMLCNKFEPLRLFSSAYDSTTD